MTFKSRFRVYYEDTDMAGIVYYANYLKFMERGRSDAVREVGVDQAMMRDAHELVFAVAHVSVDFHSPARFDEVLEVRTEVTRAGGATLEMTQEIFVDDRPIMRGQVRIACMTLEGRVARMPGPVRARLAAAMADAATS